MARARPPGEPLAPDFSPARGSTRPKPSRPVSTTRYPVADLGWRPHHDTASGSTLRPGRCQGGGRRRSSFGFRFALRINLSSTSPHPRPPSHAGVPRSSSEQTPRLPCLPAASPPRKKTGHVPLLSLTRSWPTSCSSSSGAARAGPGTSGPGPAARSTRATWSAICCNAYPGGTPPCPHLPSTSPAAPSPRKPPPTSPARPTRSSSRASARVSSAMSSPPARWASPPSWSALPAASAPPAPASPS